ncbi:Methyltransferase domain-containing protein [Algoriphagus locisalis]|uniref:Methyltransferase domain-containing protein n=1 Tax=Algoriphagus locisalis TaxID=305507 RepID=A0A1I6XRL1_9BACT|nr:methyltransferase domain-containing protein [Algoriphagus locisalis]SFT40344.1 Methyltransferase domain-containing protein [Algoriphagus locisalis]
MYKEGTYFANSKRHLEDSDFKVKAIIRLLLPILKKNEITLRSYSDVGCGAGGVLLGIADELSKNGVNLQEVKGYDISPHVNDIKIENVTFEHGDFIEIGTQTDLITLTDVFEHVPDPVDFIKKVSKKGKLVAFHIPLDNCLSVNIRGLQRQKIQNPGHLIFLDLNSALNMVTMAGLQILDYDFSKETISAPSNNETILQKVFSPLKRLLYMINPWLYSKTFGFSLVVIAKSN